MSCKFSHSSKIWKFGANKMPISEIHFLLWFDSSLRDFGSTSILIMMVAPMQDRQCLATLVLFNPTHHHIIIWSLSTSIFMMMMMMMPLCKDKYRLATFWWRCPHADVVIYFPLFPFLHTFPYHLHPYFPFLHIFPTTFIVFHRRNNLFYCPDLVFASPL